MNPRNERIQRLEKPQRGHSVSFSGDLLLAAGIMLEHALKDRKGNQNTPKKNHQSKHSIGSILLLVAGFESWLNEALAYLSNYDPLFRQQGNLRTTIEKYKYIYNWELDSYHVPEYINIKKLKADQRLQFSETIENLKIVFEVRNEIAHPMPRPTGSKWDVPPYLLPLHKKGLLITTGKPTADYSLHQKIRSYALAYWCWEVVDNAINLLTSHLYPHEPVVWTAQSFVEYKSIACPPSELLRYDFGNWRRKKKVIKEGSIDGT